MYGYMMMVMTLTIFFILLAYAYIVWALSEKSEKKIKTWGRVLAAAIAIFAVIMILFTSFSGVCPVGKRYSQKGRGSIVCPGTGNDLPSVKVPGVKLPK